MNSQDTSEVNFSLKGFASIQIGIYILLAAYLIKQLLQGFLIDDNFVGMLSVELLEIFVFSIITLTFLLSFLALYFKGKKTAKRNNFKLWNTKTKKNFWLLVLGFISLLLVLFVLNNKGLTDFITPTFLLLYGLIIFLNKNKKRKDLLLITIISLLLGILCMIIPSYWYYALFILGVSHITYGVVVKN
ncbi:MAG: hypothetical protein HWD82_09080 [Flavobacteriaceae bacterium]|nr:hypothetical protein [Flavobacteriaceae bacterium]